MLHVHEWQAAGAAMLHWEAFAQELQALRVVLTLHNMDNSGECSQEEFGFSGAPRRVLGFREGATLVASPAQASSARRPC